LTTARVSTAIDEDVQHAQNKINAQCGMNHLPAETMQQSAPRILCQACLKKIQETQLSTSCFTLFIFYLISKHLRFLWPINGKLSYAVITPCDEATLSGVAYVAVRRSSEMKNDKHFYYRFFLPECAQCSPYFSTKLCYHVFEYPCRKLLT